MNELIYYTTINSPLGELLLSSSLKGLMSIEYLINLCEPEIIKKYSSKYTCEKVKNHDTRFFKLIQELNLYFDGKLKKFSISLDLQGTNFQKIVWNTLLNIPYGETTSYSCIANQIRNSKACRAVGQANNKNPIPIIIPCHRVIGKNGNLVGYADGIQIKKWLLNHEMINKYS
ncbi:MAG: methylated-DNA--[protein]-cysteine S-methyltransferase [Spirochaetota bacterium]|nr:methylated-DNA--[protein]-cysteine S-methyltransferase [Spirochaetota bacterium]